MFKVPELVDKIVTMSLRKEIETQLEVSSLLLHLSCHVELRRLLCNRGVLVALDALKGSVYTEVEERCDIIRCLLRVEV